MNKVNDHTLNVLVIILLVIGVFLGYLVYQQAQPKSNGNNLSQTTKPGKLTEEKLVVSCTEEKRQYLGIDENKATPHELTLRRQAMACLQTPVSLVEVKDCRAFPALFQIPLGQTFKIMNTGNSETTITVRRVLPAPDGGKQDIQKFTILPSGSQNVSLNTIVQDKDVPYIYNLDCLRGKVDVNIAFFSLVNK